MQIEYCNIMTTGDGDAIEIQFADGRYILVSANDTDKGNILPLQNDFNVSLYSEDCELIQSFQFFEKDGFMHKNHSFLSNNHQFIRDCFLSDTGNGPCISFTILDNFIFSLSNNDGDNFPAKDDFLLEITDSSGEFISAYNQGGKI